MNQRPAREFSEGGISSAYSPAPKVPDKEQKPMLSLELPAGGKNHKVLVWFVPGKDGEERWVGHAFASDSWPKACIVLMNSTEQTIGLESGKLRQSIPAGQTFFFKGNNEKNGSPMKLHAADPADPKSTKLFFSSVCRVPQDDQELAILYSSNGRIMIRSFMAENEQPAAQQ